MKKVRERDVHGTLAYPKQRYILEKVSILHASNTIMMTAKR